MSTAPAPQHRLALPSGYELGRYRLQQILGSGGFGITYLAEDTSLGRRVAIKELLPNDIATRLDGASVIAKTESEEKNLSWARERFVGEGRALAACDHPNVVNVYEMVEANGTAYMVTKYEEGKSLELWLRDLGRAPNEAELRSILMPLLSGLETVHKAGFLHRDIKPENIYMTSNGRPVLLDFGSARQAITERSLAMTSIVTSGYAPFEQYHEDGNQGAWSDIYALAAVMYRAITGKKPPEATRRIKDDPCEKLAVAYAGRYDAEFLRALDRGLEVNETQRPQSIEQWRGMFGSGDRLPLESDETRLLPRAAAKPAAGGLKGLGIDPGILGGVAGGILVLLLFWQLLGQKSRPAPAPAPAPQPAPSATASAAPSAAPFVPGPQPGGSAQPSPDFSNGVVSPTPATAPGNSPPPGTAQLDPRLVGTWQLVDKKVKWEQSADGHYTLSGEWTGSGASVTSDGHLKQYPSSGNPAQEVTYEFRDETLITHGSRGDNEWTRLATDAGKSSSGKSNQSSSHKGRKVHQESAPEHILKKTFRRFR